MKSHNCIQTLLCLAVLPMLIHCLRFNLVQDDDKETGENSLVKPGVCPVYKRHNVCKIKCNIDSDCEGVKKCCPTGCGTVCEARVQNPLNREAARPKRRKQSNQEAPARKQKVRTPKKDSRGPQQRDDPILGKCPAFDSTRNCKKETIECQTNKHCEFGQTCCEFECGRKCMGNSLIEKSFESDDSGHLEVPDAKSPKKIEQFVSQIAEKEKRKQRKSLENESDEGDYDYDYEYDSYSDDESNDESEYENDYYDDQLHAYNMLQQSPQSMFATPYLSNRQNMMMALSQQQMMQQPMQHYPFAMAGMPHAANQVPFLPQAVPSFLPANRNLASVGTFIGMPRNSPASFAPIPNNFAGMHGMHPASFVGMPSVRQPMHPGLMGPPRSPAEFLAKIPKFNLAPSE